MLYGSILIFPMVFYLANTFLGAKMPLMKIASIYGYSFLAFLPASFSPIFGVMWVKIVLVVIGALHSTALNLCNYLE